MIKRFQRFSKDSLKKGWLKVEMFLNKVPTGIQKKNLEQTEFVLQLIALSFWSIEAKNYQNI